MNSSNEGDEINSSLDSQTINLEIDFPASKKKKTTNKGQKNGKWWPFFNSKKDLKGNIIHCCKKCNKESLPQNFKRHVERCDKESFNKILTGPTGKIDPPLSEFDRKKFVLYILKTILKEALPFTKFCNSEDFIYALKILNSSIEGISVDYLKKTLEKVVKKMKESVKIEIKENQPKFICLNSDLWSSLKKEEFLALSMTYINRNYERFTRIISIVNLDDFHLNGENIKTYFIKIYEEMEIQNIRKCHVTDQGGNLRSCITNHLEEEYYRCGCHLVQLILKKGFKKINDWMNPFYNLILFFKDRIPKSYLKNIFQIHEDDPLNVILDNDTRWNGTYLALKRLLEIYSKIEEALQHCNADSQLKNSRDIPRNLSARELKELKILVDFLEPFYTVTKFLEQQERVYISHVLVSFKTLLKHSQNQKMKEFKNFQEFIENEIKQIIISIPLTYKIGIYFNPSLRERLLNENEVLEIKNFLMKEYTYIEQVTSMIPSGIDRLNNIFKSDSSEEEESWEEFSKYESMGWNKEIYSDPLSFWKLQQKYLPNLSEIAKDYLCISTSSANIERLWSKAESVVTPVRSNLKPETIVEILFSMANMDLFPLFLNE